MAGMAMHSLVEAPLYECFTVPFLLPTCQHALIDDGISWQQHGITVHDAAFLRDDDDVTRHQGSSRHFHFCKQEIKDYH